MRLNTKLKQNNSFSYQNTRESSPFIYTIDSYDVRCSIGSFFPLFPSNRASLAHPTSVSTVILHLLLELLKNVQYIDTKNSFKYS